MAEMLWNLWEDREQRPLREYRAISNVGFLYCASGDTWGPAFLTSDDGCPQYLPPFSESQ